MTRYEENLKVLAEHYPGMDVLIKEAVKRGEATEELTEEQAQDGTAILRVTRGGHTCYLNGKRDAQEAARIWYETLGELPQNAPVFLMGTGNPAYLQMLAENAKNAHVIVVYEPSLQIFRWFLGQVSLRSWMEKHTIVFWLPELEGMDEKAMEGILRGIVRYELLPYTRRLILPNYDVLYEQELVTFLRTFRDIAEKQMVDYNTKRKFSTVMVKNILYNLPYLCDGYKTTQLVEVIPRDIPGIVVAAGPSLNKNVEELKAAKGKAFIIAVDTAIKPLLDAGIVPDMFALVDGLKPLMLVEREQAKNIPLLTNINAASEILHYHTGMKFFYHEGFMVSECILGRSRAKRGTVATGGSVATNAFSLLYKIGLTRIILVGQDLAYTGNKSHADGTFHEKMQEENTKNYLMVEGNVEEKVPTTGSMKFFLDWYNEQIAAMQEKNPAFRVINATEGGARIEHTEVMTLREAVAQECTKSVDIQECLSRLQPMLDEENRRWARNYLAKIPGRFTELGENAEKAAVLYQKLDKICSKKKLDSRQYLKVLKKINAQIKALRENEVYQMVDETMISAKYILVNEQLLEADTLQEEGKEIARKGVLYMENVKKMAELFREVSEDAFADILRDEEQTPDGD